jgi:succinoglycan biosynthesis transport protein ExoP
MPSPLTDFVSIDQSAPSNGDHPAREFDPPGDALGQREMWNTLRRRWRVVAGVFVVVLAAVAAFTFTRQKEYSSTAQLYFRDLGLDQKLFGTSSFVTQQTTAADASATNVGLVSIPAVSALAAAKLGISPLTVQRDVAVAPIGQSSSLVKVVATDPSPTRAADIANAVVSTFIAYRQRADRSQLTTAEALVQSQLNTLAASHQEKTSNFASLQSRGNQLQILAALQTGDAEMLQAGTIPSSPSKPNKSEYLVFGALLGLVLGTLAALLAERIDRRVRDNSEVEALLQMPILVEIPASRGLVDAWRPGGDAKEMRVVQEAFRMLVARLRYFNLDRRTQLVAVVSSLPGEGKSMVAWHLAKAAAVGGTRTLLIEADLHRPILAARHGLRVTPGLGETLPLGGAVLAEAVQHVTVADVTADFMGSEPPGLDVLVAGSSAPNPAALLESHRMTDLLRDVRASYEFIVIDTPPTSAVSDVYPLVSQVDGVVAVTHAARSERPALLDLRRQLNRLRAPALGVVANATPVRKRDYGYEAYAHAPAKNSTQPRAAESVGQASSTGRDSEYDSQDPR